MKLTDDATFTITIETRVPDQPNEIKEHGYHLGTDIRVAEKIILDMIRARKDVVSVALWRANEVVGYYDWRNLEEGMA